MLKGREVGDPVCARVGGFNFVVNGIRSHQRALYMAGQDVIYVVDFPFSFFFLRPLVVI